MLQRLRALQDASLTGRPTQLLPHLYVSGAVEANSLHILRHLGISRILNATEDLLLPEGSAGFRSRALHFPVIPHLGSAQCRDHTQLFIDLLHHISRCFDCSFCATYTSFLLLNTDRSLPTVTSLSLATLLSTKVKRNPTGSCMGTTTLS